MKRFLFVISILFSLLACSQEEQKQGQKLYVGTFTSEGAEGIYMCDFNVETGDLTLEKTFKGIDNPSFLKVSDDRKYLYAVSRVDAKVEKSGGYVMAYEIRKNGDLKFLNKQISNGAGPCHVDVSKDGKYVAIATYGGGTTSLYTVNDNGSLQPASTIITNKGSGPNKKRQNEPHAHSIKFSKSSNQVYSADLGTDRFNIYEIQNNQLVEAPQKLAKLAPGAGPRHFDFHPHWDVIYVINELNSTITAFKRKLQAWKEFQTISTLPHGFEGENYCADIHVAPNGKFLYASNRGDNSIAVFAIAGGTSQRLISMGTVSCKGDWPRNFTISPDGKYLLVANQKSGDIKVFTIDDETGIPIYTGKDIKLPSPVCLEFL